MNKRTYKEWFRGFREFSFSSFGFASATYTPPPDEREVVLKLLVHLADRRVLFHSSCRVVHQDMIASLEKMRDNITCALEQIPESAASPFLAQMRKACHDFQSLVESYFSIGTDEPLQADFHIGIRELRRTIGLCVSQLSSIYHFDIEGDLALILPDGTMKMPNQGMQQDGPAARR